MKKYLILLLLLSLIGLTSCSNDINFKETKEFKTLGKPIYPSLEYKNTRIEKSTTSIITEFTKKTTKEIFLKDSSKNELYSPLSLYIALSMLLEGVENEANRELLNLLGMPDTDTIKREVKKIYENDYYKNEYGELKMANSLWVKNGLTVKDDYVNSLKDNYFAEMYQTSFNDEGIENICDWINHYTNDLLKMTKEKYNLDTTNLMLLLLNTIYFDNKWAYEYDKKKTYTDVFYGISENNADYMKHSFSSLYYSSENYISCYDYFKNNNKIKYILPNEDISVYDVLKEDIFNPLNVGENVNLTLSTPKIKYDCEYNFNKALNNLGVVSIFSNVNDFNILENKDIVVSFVKQNTAIEFNEDGVKAAAVTSIGVKDAAVEPSKMIEVVLNRPYIYIIYDSNNIPLFVGIVNNAD